MEIKVVIPTYKRAGKVTTLSVVSKAILCVADSEEGQYRDVYPNAEMVCHPDYIVGLPAKRQWIYEKFGDVMMVDDDAKFFQAVYATKQKKYSPDAVYEIIQWCGNMAALSGCFLFGFSKNVNPTLYHPQTPIILSGLVSGGSLGILQGSQLSFLPSNVPRYMAADDFFISGLNAYYHRKLFIDSRFNFVFKDTFVQSGGQGSYRTLDTEKHTTLFLRQMFGERIILKRSIFGAKGSKRSTVNKNPFGRSFSIPF